MASFLLCLAYFLACLPVSVLADKPVFSPQDADRYDRGMYGRAPAERLHSTDIPAMRLLRRVWDEEQCASPDSHYLIATRGREARAGPSPHAGPVIFNSEGHQVWFGQGYEPMYNFRSQMYKGEQVLTFWAGRELRGGHGDGTYYILDKNYREIMKVLPCANYTADLHEFKIVPGQDTALLSSYPQRSWRYDRWPTNQNETDIWDCVFQEVDLETGQLLFQWRASDHFAPEDCYNPKPERRPSIPRPPQPPRPQPLGMPQPPGMPDRAGPLPDRPQRTTSMMDVWDWFHMNSIDKDAKGNYLVSSRYSHSLTYIDGETGNILWQLGGKNNSFTDLSGGRATKFAWQHHATWVDNYTAVTLFDNEAVSWAPGRKNAESGASRALKVRIDQQAMTAQIVMEGMHPQGYSTQSQGSIEQLENGNFFVGYGNTAAMAEFSPEGKVVCDFQYGALHYRSNNMFSPGGIQSYRAFKITGWKGYPLDNPKFAFDSRKFYVSWNGATEVREWVLDGKSLGGGGGSQLLSRAPQWVAVGRTKWMGFESEIPVKRFKFDMFKLTALDCDGKALGRWLVLPSGSIEPMEETFLETNRVLSTHILYLSALLFLAFLIYKIRGVLSSSRHKQPTRYATATTNTPSSHSAARSSSTLGAVISLFRLSVAIVAVRLLGTKSALAEKRGRRDKRDEEKAGSEEQMALNGHTSSGAKEY